MASVHKIKDRSATVRPEAVELLGELTGRLVLAVTPTPIEERNSKQFECPLCVDVFKIFFHLQRHLLSMHPRREMILKLVMERYGISERCGETETSAALDSQHAHEPSTCCAEGAGKKQPVLKETGTTTHTFKVPLQPSRKTAALPQIRSHKCERRCKEFLCRRELSPSEESSSWKSYLSFCLSNDGSSEPLHGHH